MKKAISILLSLILVAFSCAALAESQTVRIGGTPVPHVEILEFIKPLMAEKGFELEISTFNDYVIPNTAVEDGSLDANYFQHGPYLTTFNADHGYDLANAAAIHYEPMGIYPGSKSSLDELAEGDIIAIPNDGSNETRALLILQELGYKIGRAHV